jgi:hypothetical protein
MVNVTKWDGRLEPFDRRKIYKTLLRLGASTNVAEEISKEVESKIYDGIKTKEVLDVAFGLLGERKPSAVHMKDLKTALGAMIPMPDFEEYVRILLRAKGYKVAPNKVIQGFCVTHEIDGILEKDGETIYLEVKNHSNPHISTPFNVTLAAKAKWDDIQRGYDKELNEHSFDRVLIVCNTRLTKHAEDYARCTGLDHVGWNAPKGAGIDSIISETRIYPVTILRTLTDNDHHKLSEAGIITLNQLTTNDLSGVKITKSRKEALHREATVVLNSNIKEN